MDLLSVVSRTNSENLEVFMVQSEMILMKDIRKTKFQVEIQ